MMLTNGDWERGTTYRYEFLIKPDQSCNQLKDEKGVYWVREVSYRMKL